MDVVRQLAFSLGPGQEPLWFTDACNQKDFPEQLNGLLAAMLADYPDVSGPYRFTQSTADQAYERFLLLESRDDSASVSQGEADDESARAELCREWLKTTGQARVYDGVTWHGLKLHISSTAPTEQRLLNLLYRQAGLGPSSPYEERRLRAPRDGNQDASVLSREGVAGVETFALGLLTHLHADPGVKRANLYMAAFRSYEQFAMWVAFFWMVLLLLARWIRRIPEETQADGLIDQARAENVALHNAPVEARLEAARRIQDGNGESRPSIARLLLKVCIDQLSRQGAEHDKTALQETGRQLRQNDALSRWPLVWLARIIPALGFLGTVHGIALALMGADTIVRASTPAAQAAAVNAVAGNLGIAFTTTFFALLMGILLSWFSDLQAYREKSFVNELERELGYLLDPIGFDAQATLQIVARAPDSPQRAAAASRVRPSAEAAALGLEIPPERARHSVGRVVVEWSILVVATASYVRYCPLASLQRLTALTEGGASASEWLVVLWPTATLVAVAVLAWRTRRWLDDGAHNRAVLRALKWQHQREP